MPKIKLSNNPSKVTLPGIKKVIRIYDKTTNKIKADLITLEHETYDENNPLTLFDQTATWKRMELKPGSYYLRELLTPVFVNGECVYTSPKTMEIREYAQKELNTLWDEHRRLANPHTVPVDLSEELYVLRERMIREFK